jgi:GST-like protein
MIDLYTWTTPNGYKPIFMLEELGLDYQLNWVSLDGDQHKPDFLRISPNGKIPAIVDRETDNAIFESGAILIYLAEKTGRFLPGEEPARSHTLSWVMFQMASVGPMFGQYYHFKHSAPETLPYAVTRYQKEAERLYGVMERRLAEAEFLAGEFSIADMLTYPWVNQPQGFEVDPEAHPNVMRWIRTIAARPAIQRGQARKP